MKTLRRRARENEIDSLADLLAREIVARVEEYPEAEVPVGQKKIGREEQRVKYAQMRGDSQAWFKILSERGIDDTLAYWRAMEGKHAGT